MPDAAVQVFPIRHHGPGSARSLLGALEALQPDVVLVEGPADADALLPFLAHEALVPPVALLAYVPGEEGRSVMYPFAAFSPEFVAFRWALQRGVRAGFMDLPSSVTLAERDVPEAPQDTTENEAVPAEPSPADLLRRDPLGTMARAAGFTDFERWWEALAEAAPSGEDVFAAVRDLMRVAREDHDLPEREAQREAQMRQTIRAALKAGAQRVAVVCGAWHAPALEDLDARGRAKEDAALLKGLPKVKTSVTWVPWSHDRLTYASGYGAGVHSPGWYAHLWAGHARPVETWLTEAARMLRGRGVDISSAHVIEASRLAEALAALRGLPLAGLPELMEAARAVFTWVSDAPLQLIEQELVIGTALGVVPTDVPSVPLAQDVAAQQKTLRLKPETVVREVTLDLREDAGLARSVFLHRLNVLGVPWGERRYVGGRGTFKEAWALKWMPEFAVRLVEASRYGGTVVRAANARAAQVARAARTLPELTGLLEDVRAANLRDAARVALAQLDARGAATSDAAELLGALPPLARLARYGDVRSREEDEGALEVFRTLLTRGALNLPGAALNLADDAAQALVRVVADADAAVRLVNDEECQGVWLAALHELAGQDGAHDLLLGDATRRLRDAGTLAEGDVRARVGLALAPARSPVAVSAWLDGFLGADATLLLHDARLLNLLDTWLAGLPDEAFEGVLPPLRRVFSRLSVGDRRELGEQVRGHRRGGEVVEVHEARSALPVPFVLRLLGVNA
ncbi:DUF5682 family protein [Deinococcus maricopensis]|uniref:Uncharacterized protein n=1 Tax=Deinococcus maricopensis (strain DSM 21211 / LMG 22137 / NRRL B-23946 / LB-34) TaxID=709986 RepID=E8U5J8_DEIML|nr:DUF5682 family protein [Deinococcus maricopensis]ADV66337.1 hypothetical protein Deima_0680 [Deinococcus maricopensis DSM 21211]